MQKTTQTLPKALAQVPAFCKSFDKVLGTNPLCPNGVQPRCFSPFRSDAPPVILKLVKKFTCCSCLGKARGSAARPLSFFFLCEARRSAENGLVTCSLWAQAHAAHAPDLPMLKEQIPCWKSLPLKMPIEIHPNNPDRSLQNEETRSQANPMNN